MQIQCHNGSALDGHVETLVFVLLISQESRFPRPNPKSTVIAIGSGIRRIDKQNGLTRKRRDHDATTHDERDPTAIPDATFTLWVKVLERVGRVLPMRRGSIIHAADTVEWQGFDSYADDENRST